MRLQYLDSSRGIAACMVLLAHFQLTVLPGLSTSWIYKTPIRIIADGDAAVLYFFMLSGYVLTLSMKHKEANSIFLYLRFVEKRFFRIYPAFLTVLIVSFSILKFINVTTMTWLDRFWQFNTGIFGLLEQTLLIVRLPNDPLLRFLPHDWTLSIEIAVSLLLPLLAVFAKRSPLIMLVIVYAAVQFLRLDPFVFDFALGVFLAGFSVKDFQLFVNRAGIFTLGLTAVLLICTDYLFPSIMKHADLFLIHHKIWGLAIILILILSKDKVRNILSKKPLIFLGRISYSFYLWHLILLYLLVVTLDMLHPALFFLIYVVLTIVISALSYISIEKPFLKMKILPSDKAS